MNGKILYLLGLTWVLSLAGAHDCRATYSEDYCKGICEGKFNYCAEGQGVPDRARCIQNIVRSIQDEPSYGNCKDFAVCQQGAGDATLARATQSVGATKVEENCNKLCEARFNRCAYGPEFTDDAARQTCMDNILTAIENNPQIYGNCKDFKGCDKATSMMILQEANVSRASGNAGAQ